jgi:hypothetical protein
MMTAHYRILYRLGHWGSLEAECRSGLTDHKATFVLLNKFGERFYLGMALFTGQADRLSVFDGDGETFPTLAAAVRAHASGLMTVTEMPRGEIGKERSTRIDTWQDCGDRVRQARVMTMDGGAR